MTKIINATARNTQNKKLVSDNAPFCKPLRKPINLEINQIKIKMLNTVANNNSKSPAAIPLADKKASLL